MADISNYRPTITKKGKVSQKLFWNKFFLLVILMVYMSNDGTHNYLKRNFLIVSITILKTILEQNFHF